MNHDDDSAAPLLAVIAGLAGVGKSTVLHHLQQQPGLPRQVLADAPDLAAFNDAMLGVLALRASVVIESRFDAPDLLRWMHLADERGYDIELVWIGVEDDALAGLRTRARRTRHQVDQALMRMAAAVDIAKRVLIIDNSTAQPIMAARIEADTVQQLDTRPGWVARRVLAPKLARHASLAAIKAAYAALAARAPVPPLL